jgi:E3 ubiquitin-protein ligase HERC4
VESLSQFKVLQVACGGHHNLALLKSGRVFSWGSNKYGQLGLRATVLANSSPQEVVALLGLPILHIAAGDAHSMVVSQSGAVYGWGRNTFGQLGVGHEKDTPEPTELSTLRTQRVKYISCGETHSAALTEDGGLFTFGSSSFGQLGHNATPSHSTTYPTKVFELMGSTVTQVACGRCHTLALVKSSGKLYGFGLGSSGQLGVGSTGNVATPTLVQGNWMNKEVLPSLLGTSVDPNEVEGVVVRRVFAGGDQSFASLVVPGEQDGSVIGDCRRKHLSCLPPSIDYEGVKKLLDEALITKDYSRAARYPNDCTEFVHCFHPLSSVSLTCIYM